MDCVHGLPITWCGRDRHQGQGGEAKNNFDTDRRCDGAAPVPLSLTSPSCTPIPGFSHMTPLTLEQNRHLVSGAHSNSLGVPTSATITGACGAGLSPVIQGFPTTSLLQSMTPNWRHSLWRSLVTPGTQHFSRVLRLLCNGSNESQCSFQVGRCSTFIYKQVLRKVAHGFLGYWTWEYKTLFLLFFGG